MIVPGAVTVVLAAIGTPKIRSWLRLTRADVHYEVRLRDGGSIPVSIRYLLPSGEARVERTETPWRSREMTFRFGDLLSIEADTDEDAPSPLQCRLVSMEGDWLESHITDPPPRCATNHELRQWPPAVPGTLIRVG